MSHRWAPPGDGWTRTVDYGDLAIWMRPEDDGLSIAIYTGDGFGHLDDTAETWVVRVPRGSSVPYRVMDKPHRIRWVLDAEPGDRDSCALDVQRRAVPRSHAGHRRLNVNRRIWHWPLPRRVLEAFEIP